MLATSLNCAKHSWASSAAIARRITTASSTTSATLSSRSSNADSDNEDLHAAAALNKLTPPFAAMTAAATSTASSYHHFKAEPHYGFIFDIDGVLLRGKKLLPRTRDTMRMITDKSGRFIVPTIFVTNAGNELRSTKSAKLSQLLGVRVAPEQVVMSHSPLRLLKKFHHKHCLISGQGPIAEIAKNLGFTHATTVDDLRQSFPQFDVVDHKRRAFAPCVLGRYFPPIEAVILFGESIRWETNLQLIIDVLMCNGRLDQHVTGFPERHMPIMACNADFVWMAEASMPRFGHGTFLYCLEQIYGKLSGGRELKYEVVVGKPNEITYYCAENMMQEHAKAIGIRQKIRNLYAIGDNIDTDIYGANLFNRVLENGKHHHHEQDQQSSSSQGIKSKKTGLLQRNETNVISEQRVRGLITDDGGLLSVLGAQSIKSMLVCTGVFSRGNAAASHVSVDDVMNTLNYAHKDTLIDPALAKPNFICNDVYDAVKLVLEREN